jgi:uncharacterized protein (DUF983 family)
MKRGFQYTCPHVGADTMYVSTFADVQRVKVCATCAQAVNENPGDPRGIAFTVSGAVKLRDQKHAPR